MNCEIINLWVYLHMERTLEDSSPQFVSGETETKRGEGVFANSRYPSVASQTRPHSKNIQENQALY